LAPPPLLAENILDGNITKGNNFLSHQSSSNAKERSVAFNAIVKSVDLKVEEVGGGYEVGGKYQTIWHASTSNAGR